MDLLAERVSKKALLLCITT